MDKAPEAFRTISEVAEEISVPQHVLRFWESRFGQIRPMKRGGGRRYYRPDDVDLLRGVRHLLYGEGYTIRGVQRILREEGVAFVQSVWREGSAPPPPESHDDDDEGEEESGADNDLEARRAHEAAFFDGQSGSTNGTLDDGRPRHREPALMAPPPGEDGRRKLNAVLDDLIACRRLIEAALSEDYSAEVGSHEREV